MASFLDIAGVDAPGKKDADTAQSFLGMAGVDAPPSAGKTVIGTTPGTGLGQRTIDFLSESVSKPILNALISSGLSATEAVNTMMTSLQKNMQGYGKEMAKAAPELAQSTQTTPINLDMSKGVQNAREKAQSIGLLEPGIATAVGGAIGSAAPYFLVPEISGVAPLIESGMAKAIPNLIPKAASEIGKQTAIGAGMGTLLNPEDRGIGAAVGATGAGGATLAAKGGAKAYDAIKNALNRGLAKEVQPVIKERIGSIMADLKGGSSKETSSGDVYGNIEQFYNEMRGFPSKGQQLTSKYVKPEESAATAYSKANQVKLKNFDRTAFDRSIDSNVAKLDKSIKLAGKESVLAKPYQEMRDILTDIKTANISTAEDVSAFKAIINNQIASIGRDSPIASIKPKLSEIKKGLFQSLHDSADAEGKKLLEKADTLYREKVGPFKELFKKDSPFIKAYHGEQTADTIVNDYLKPGAQKDQAERLENFLKILPDESTKKLAAYDFFKSADTDLGADAHAFIKKYSALGEKQKKLLLPEYKEELDNLANLAKKFPKAFKESPTFTTGEKMLGGASALGAMGSLYAHSPLGMAAALSPIAAKGAIKMLGANPKIQQKFISEAAKESINPSILKSLFTKSGGAVPPILATLVQQYARGER